MNFYHKLLELPESETPPDHYELLGVPRFTDDPKEIHAAAVTRNSQLRSWDNSKFYRDANSLLDEVVAAAFTLEDPIKKAAYDAELRLRLGLEPPPPAASPQTGTTDQDSDWEELPELPKPVRAKKSKPKPDASEEKVRWSLDTISFWPWVAAASVSAVLVFAVAIGLTRSLPQGRDTPSATTVAGVPVSATAPDTGGVQAWRVDQLKQIGLALHKHHDTFRSLPPSNNPKFFNAEGKTHLSWRVHVLMFLGENALYQQFHLDEPWDSPHNKPLSEKLPDAFQTRGVARPGFTNILAISGPGTAFTGQKGVQLRDFADGLSNTILVVEASPEKAVLWTTPDDLVVDRDNPAACFGSWPAQGLLVLFADGSVRRIATNVSPESLNAHFTISGGENVPPL